MTQNDTVGPSPTPDDSTISHGGPTRPTDADAGRLGHYRLIELLGQGGQGAVYLAEDEKLGRRVALKILTGVVGNLSRNALRRFRREAEATASLNHPGISVVYEAGKADGSNYIAMRHVEGESLAAGLASSRQTAATGDSSTTSSQGQVTAVIELIEKAARALHVAHEAGIIHRDIKPANIMVTPEGQPVLLDFGLARIEAEDGHGMTVSGDFMGTPAYMSPEQITASRISVDSRSDVYSLGVTLYECLTLSRPFDAPTRDGLYQAIIAKEPPNPRKLNRWIPQDLKVVIETAIEKDRDRRYQTALALAEELRRVRERVPIHARPAGLARRAIRWMQRRPAQATAMALGVLLLLAAAVFVVQVGKERDTADRERDLAQLARDAAQQSEKEARAAEAEARASEKRAVAAEADARAAEATASARLDDFERLADSKRLDELQVRSGKLWPAVRENVPGLAAWIEAGDALVEKLPLHRDTLAALRDRSEDYTDADREEDARTHPQAGRLTTALAERAELQATLEAAHAEAAAPAETAEPDAAPESAESDESAEKQPSRAERVVAIESRLAELAETITGLEKTVAQRQTYRFEATEDEFMHEQLSALVVALDALAAPEALPGTVADVRSRLGFARSIEERSVSGAEAAAAWSACIAHVAGHSVYGGLELTPQVGLLPIGKNPDPPHLWEFVHLQTGEAPTRDESNRLELSEEMGVVLVLIPGDEFLMGAQKEDETGANYDPQAKSSETPHLVTVPSFFLSKYEFTQAQWQRFTGQNPSGYQAPSALAANHLHPIEGADWNESKKVCGQLGLRLPSESEWEFSCRARTRTAWWCGQDEGDLKGLANLGDLTLQERGGQGPFVAWHDGYAVHAPVGSFTANPWGLHDMAGNVHEWCEDSYGAYGAAPIDGTAAADLRAPFRTHRGGGWNGPPRYCRSASRSFGPPNLRGDLLGFRPARSIVP